MTPYSPIMAPPDRCARVTREGRRDRRRRAARSPAMAGTVLGMLKAYVDVAAGAQRLVVVDVPVDGAGPARLRGGGA